jgi:hypothetical protein
MAVFDVLEIFNLRISSMSQLGANSTVDQPVPAGDLSQVTSQILE